MKLIRSLLIGAALLVAGIGLQAGPASPGVIKLSQPDGSVIQARLRGDEFQAWMETLDGYTIAKNPSTGQWEYGILDAQSGAVQPSGLLVRPDAKAPASLEPHLKPARNFESEALHLKALQSIHREQARELPGAPALGAQLEAATLSGTRKLLIILVNFTNRTLTTTPAGWNSTIFQTGTGVKSVRQFYRDNSFNTLDIVPVPHTQPGNPAGIISVSIGLAHPNSGKTWDYATETAWLNLALAQAVPYVDFAALDTNADGVIRSSEAVIYFIPAGYETSGTALTPSIWAHAWGGSITAGTKTVSTWAMNGELNNGSRQHPMGVIAHELGHSMAGLPDLYDTNSVNAGLGYFSLMAYGSWGSDTSEEGGTTPVSLDAWCRQFLGWTVPGTPTLNGQVVTLGSNLSDSAAATKLQNSGLSTQEYFLVENRYPAGWDRGLVRWFGVTWAGGLLALHVDGAIASNQYVTGSHQMVMAEHADNAAYGSYGKGTSLFYTANDPLFTPSSLPSSSYYSGSPSGVGFTSASDPGTTMSFTMYAVQDDTPPTGQPGKPVGVPSEDTVTYSWTLGTAADPESGIAGYHLQVGTTAGGSDVFSGPVGNVLTKKLTDLGLRDGVPLFARVAAMNGAALKSAWSDSSDAISIALPLFDGTVLDNVNFTFKTVGPWTATSSTSYYGGSCAQSAVTPDNGQTYLQTRATGPGTLAFYWKVNSEASYDFLSFSIDGVLQAGQISGSTAFAKQTFTLAAGSHILRWTYAKDPNTAPVGDAAWVDYVVWTPLATATIAPLTYTTLVSTVRPYTATVTNGLSNSSANWSISNSGGTFSPTQTASGVATSLTTTSTPGTYLLTATPVETPNLPGTANLTLVNPASVSVSVSPGATTLSVNAPATFTASVSLLSDASVTWSKSGGTFGTQTGNSAVWSTSTPGDYTLTATSSVATGRSATATVTVLSTPTISSFTASGPIASGSAATLTANFAGGTGSLDHGLGVVTSGSPVSTGTLTTSTTYTLTVTNAANTTVTAQTTVTVVQPPLTPVLTVPASVTAGATGLVATVPTQVGSTYTWTITGGTITGGQGTTSLTFTVGSAGSLTLSCSVTNSLGVASAPGSATLTVVPAPLTPVLTAPASVTAGVTGLVATVPAQAGSTYTWTLTGGSITGGQGTTTLTFTAGSAGSLTLSCSVTNAAGTASSPGSATVTVVPAPLTPVLTAPASVTASATGLVATVPTQVGSTYTWTITGGSITGGQGTTTLTFTAGSAGSLTLSCSVTNALGVTSAPGSTTLTVVPAPLTPVLTAPATVTTGATGLVATVPTQAGSTCTWTITGGTITGGQGTTSLTFTAGSPGSLTLSCTVSNAVGTTSAPGTATVLVIDPTAVQVDRPTATLVSGSKVTLVGSTGLGSINWSVTPGQGSLSASSTLSGVANTYTAPDNLMANLTVTVTLCNATNPLKTATAVLTVKTANLNGDAVIDLQDLLTLAQDWGTTTARSRLSGGAVVGATDLNLLLAALGF